MLKDFDSFLRSNRWMASGSRWEWRQSSKLFKNEWNEVGNVWNEAGNVWTKSAKPVVLEPLDPAPGPFMEQSPFLLLLRVSLQPCQLYAPGNKKEAKGKSAIVPYCKKVANVASAFKNADSAEKDEMTKRLVEELRNKGNYFVFEKNDAQQQMEQMKVLEKVWHSLRDCERMREWKMLERQGSQFLREKHCGGRLQEWLCGRSVGNPRQR